MIALSLWRLVVRWLRQDLHLHSSRFKGDAFAIFATEPGRVEHPVLLEYI